MDKGVIPIDWAKGIIWASGGLRAGGGDRTGPIARYHAGEERGSELGEID